MPFSKMNLFNVFIKTLKIGQQALEETALTLLVFEVKCPLKVPDEASPVETCPPTSGPDPTHTHTHTCIRAEKKHVAIPVAAVRNYKSNFTLSVDHDPGVLGQLQLDFQYSPFGLQDKSINKY